MSNIQEVPHGNEVYPWRLWANGKLKRAKAGKHFSVSPDSFIRALRMHARRNSLKVVTRKAKSGTVTFQFFRIET
jgi:hypothetical protein